MNRCHNFAKNLEMFQKKYASMTEFSEELDVPKSTLQDILKDGNTSLHTTLHIAEQLKVPLSVLTGEVTSAENLTVLPPFLQSLEWFSSLSAEQQREVTVHIRAILEVLQK